MRLFKNISRLFAAIAAVTVTATQFARADEPIVEDDDGITVEAQPLASALQEFSAQSGLQVAYVATLAEEVNSKGTHEAETADAALSEILDSTGLEYRFINDETVAIGPAASSENEAEDPGNSHATPRTMMVRASIDMNEQTEEAAENRQEDSAEAKYQGLPIEEIIVTGTNIRGATNLASPVRSFDDEDIDLSGQSTTTDFIQTLPQNFPGERTTTASPIPGANPGLSFGGSSVDLRGLGSDSTLILVNGRRTVLGGASSFVDTSLIPLSAIDHIEVLTDGASAIYGSDAIGGVINFILKDSFDGAETSVRYGTFTKGDGYEAQASQLLGTSWTSGSALISYEYFKKTHLDSTDRTFTDDAPQPFFLKPDETRHGAFAAVSQKLSHSISISGTAKYARRKSNTVSFISALVNSQHSSVEQYGGSLSIEADLGSSWSAELYGVYSNYTADTISEVGSQPPNSFSIENRLWSAEGKVDGPIFKGAGGDTKLALGGGYRRERINDRLGKLITSGPTILDKDVSYAFGELHIPIVSEQNEMPGVQDLILSVAGRFEDHSDVGSSTDGKVGLAWSPTDDLVFRGTYGTSFRAPSLFETAPGFQVAFFINVPDPLSPTGQSLLLDELGNPGGGLKPEQAAIYTAGLDFEPAFLPGLTASVTYFNIDFTDRLATPSVNIFTFLGDPAFDPVITRNPAVADIEAYLATVDLVANSSGIIDPNLRNSSVDVVLNSRLQNLERTKTSGIDVHIGYTRETSIGTFSVDASGTYLTRQNVQFTSAAPSRSILNTFGNPIDLRLRNRLSWSNGGWGAAMFVNYADSYKNDNFDPEQKIDSFTTVDLTLSYDTADRSSLGLLKNTRFTFSTLNVFDQDPPFTEDRFGNNINFDALNTTSLGRFASFRITKAW